MTLQIRFPVRYYTTAEDLVSYVLKDRGVADSALDYQLSVVKTPFKGLKTLSTCIYPVFTQTPNIYLGVKFWRLCCPTFIFLPTQRNERILYLRYNECSLNSIIL